MKVPIPREYNAPRGKTYIAVISRQKQIFQNIREVSACLLIFNQAGPRVIAAWFYSKWGLRDLEAYPVGDRY
jgi:hypothetical protein